jgi:hypothetical protein
MLVWRVQNKDRVGPYYDVEFDDDMWHDMHRKHSRCEKHPSIRVDLSSDDRYGFTYKHVCGFLTKRYALEWFHGYLEFLETLGFNLVQVEANPTTILYGEGPFGQIAFIPAENMNDESKRIWKLIKVNDFGLFQGTLKKDAWYPDPSKFDKSETIKAGTVVTIWCASRFGWIGVTPNLIDINGYDACLSCEANPGEISDWIENVEPR